MNWKCVQLACRRQSRLLRCHSILAILPSCLPATPVPESIRPLSCLVIPSRPSLARMARPASSPLLRPLAPTRKTAWWSCWSSRRAAPRNSCAPRRQVRRERVAGWQPGVAGVPKVQHRRTHARARSSPPISRRLHLPAAAGAEVLVSAPMGKGFHVDTIPPADVHTVLIFATGSGARRALRGRLRVPQACHEPHCRRCLSVVGRVVCSAAVGEGWDRTARPPLAYAPLPSNTRRHLPHPRADRVWRAAGRRAEGRSPLLWCGHGRALPRAVTHACFGAVPSQGASGQLPEGRLHALPCRC